MKKIMNYDPNLTLCGRMAKQKVRLVFGNWKYRLETVVEVGGNTRGLSVIDCAIGSFYSKLPTYKNYPDVAYITFKDGDKECLHEDEDKKYEDWLKDMLISAEIVSIVPDEGLKKKLIK